MDRWGANEIIDLTTDDGDDESNNCITTNSNNSVFYHPAAIDEPSILSTIASTSIELPGNKANINSLSTNRFSNNFINFRYSFLGTEDRNNPNHLPTSQPIASKQNRSLDIIYIDFSSDSESELHLQTMGANASSSKPGSKSSIPTNNSSSGNSTSNRTNKVLQTLNSARQFTAGREANTKFTAGNVANTKSTAENEINSIKSQAAPQAPAVATAQRPSHSIITSSSSIPVATSSHTWLPTPSIPAAKVQQRASTFPNPIVSAPRSVASIENCFHRSNPNGPTSTEPVVNSTKIGPETSLVAMFAKKPSLEATNGSSSNAISSQSVASDAEKIVEVHSMNQAVVRTSTDAGIATSRVLTDAIFRSEKTVDEKGLFDSSMIGSQSSHSTNTPAAINPTANPTTGIAPTTKSSVRPQTSSQSPKRQPSLRNYLTDTAPSPSKSPSLSARFTSSSTIATARATISKARSPNHRSIQKATSTTTATGTSSEPLSQPKNANAVLTNGRPRIQSPPSTKPAAPTSTEDEGRDWGAGEAPSAEALRDLAQRGLVVGAKVLAKYTAAAKSQYAAKVADIRCFSISSSTSSNHSGSLGDVVEAIEVLNRR